ncbi:MAG: carbohydrate kinase family protein [Candidatus Freyarchaeota archaeon]|mgnify:CR=1 FL=1|nr:sugar kinase [Candidatus Freyrarchaeum guaymaensis]
MVDVVCLGEVIADFIPVGEREFKLCFGGAPMNTAIACSRLGLSTATIASVGDDPFGSFLLGTLRGSGVDVRRVRVKPLRTTLAFVSRVKGENEFFFYRRPWVISADTEIDLGEEDLKLALKAKVFHFTGLPLSHEPLRESIMEFVGKLRGSVIVSFDPTYRPDSWVSKEEAREATIKAMSTSDVILATIEEFRLVLGVEEAEDAVRECLRLGAKMVGVKMGGRGACLSDDSTLWVMDAYPVKVVDTVGAGDAWNSGIIYGLVKGLHVSDTLKLANAVAALSCTAPGAVEGLPTIREVNDLVSKFPHLKPKPVQS